MGKVSKTKEKKSNNKTPDKCSLYFTFQKKRTKRKEKKKKCYEKKRNNRYGKK